MSAAPEPTNPILDAARTYAAHGWRVIPIIAGQKRPSFTDWPSVATVDPDRIANWWGHGDRYGVGIVTGEQSGIWVLDVDIADGKAGAATLDDLEDTYGPLPHTVRTITGSGGWHIFFRWDPDHPVGTNGGRLGPGLDVRGEGGQVVAPPTIHPNGTPYRWNLNCSPDDIEVADAPPWLLELLRPVEAPTVPTLAPVPTTDEHDDSPAAWFNDRTTWHMLLQRDGWTLTRTLGSGEQQWTRPGKEGRDGISATVGHQGRDVLKVFTSSVAGLDADGAYSRFGYEAAMHHHGNRSELARQIRTGHTTIGGHAMPRHHDDLSWALTADFTPAPPTSPDGAPQAVEAPDPLAHLHIVDWADFWDRDPAEQDWLIWPLVPAGRQVSLYAPAKAGKSTVLLHAITTVIAGGGWLGSDRPDRIPTTLYLDFEMTEDDLQERLEEFGYDRTANLDHLHYAVLPSLDPLDTATGAHQVVTAAEAVGAELVVIDTFGRAVAGEEDSADTVRAFYRHTGLALKQRGIALLRTDHTGKDAAKGQRGTSAKADDVDVVWKLTRTDDGAKLECTHKRVSWVPKDIDLIRTDHDGRIGFVAREGHGRGYLPGTAELASLLDDLEVAPDATVTVAMEALRNAGQGKQKQKVSDAQRYRKSEARRAAERDLSDLVPGPGTAPGTAISEPSGNREPEPSEPNAKAQVRGTEPLPEPPEPSNPGVLGTARVTNKEPVRGRLDGTDNDLNTDDPYAELF